MFIDKHYDSLVAHGQEFANAQPASMLKAPALGMLAWQGAGGEELLKVHSLHVPAERKPGMISGLDSIGFTPKMQREGFWVVRDPRDYREQTSVPVYAHYNPGTGQWHAMRAIVPNRSAEFSENWEKTSLDPKELGAIARVGWMTDIVADAIKMLPGRMYDQYLGAFMSMHADRIGDQAGHKAIKGLRFGMPNAPEGFVPILWRLPTILRLVRARLDGTDAGTYNPYKIGEGGDKLANMVTGNPQLRPAVPPGGPYPTNQ